MTRRPPAPASASTSAALALVAVVALAALRPAPARGSTLDLNLHNTGSTAWTQVVDLNVDPAGAVVPSTSGSSPSPLTVMTDSYGFDPSALKVYLASGTYNQNVGTHKIGDPVELIPLDFGAKGLAPGADMHFTLNLASNESPANVQISLPPSVAPTLGLNDTFTPQPAPASQAMALPVTATPAANTPEPAALALWAAMAVLALTRVRAIRRTRGPGLGFIRP